MRPATNYVLVEPFGYQPFDKGAGLVVNELDKEHLLQAQAGKVVAVCDRLQYDGEEVHTYMNGRTLSFHEQNYVGYLTQKSVYYDVPIEVEAGDTVLYRWMANTSTAMHVNGLILIRYDNMVAKEKDGRLEPLNGIVLIRMKNEDSRDQFLRQRSMRRSVAEVVAEGCLIKGYLPFVGARDEPGELMGHEVVFDHRMAVRIENDNFALFNYDSEYPYYAIRRNDIHAVI